MVSSEIIELTERLKDALRVEYQEQEARKFIAEKIGGRDLLDELDQKSERIEELEDEVRDLEKERDRLETRILKLEETVAALTEAA